MDKIMAKRISCVFLIAVLMICPLPGCGSTESKDAAAESASANIQETAAEIENTVEESAAIEGPAGNETVVSMKDTTSDDPKISKGITGF